MWYNKNNIFNIIKINIKIWISLFWRHKKWVNKFLNNLLGGVVQIIKRR